MEPIQDTSDNDCLALLDAACAATRSQLAVASQQTAELQRENKSHVAALEAARAEAAAARAEAAGLRDGMRTTKEERDHSTEQMAMPSTRLEQRDRTAAANGQALAEERTAHWSSASRSWTPRLNGAMMRSPRWRPPLRQEKSA